MLTTKRFDAPLTIKSVNESGEFEGYGSIFGNKDSYADIIMPGAFQKSLSAWAEKGRLPAMLWQHRMDEPIGIYTEIKEDEVGLYVKGRLLIDDDPLARRAHGHMKAGSLTGMSIGYMLGDWEYSRDKEAWMVKEVDLWEVSLVTFPANEEARISNVKTALERGETPRPSDVERALREAGFTKSQAQGFMAKGYGSIVPRDAERSDALESIKNIMSRI
jgi:hypothetical protein